jgi:hypothetical protein
VRVHEYIEAILLSYAQRADSVLYELLVVLSWTRMFQSFPCEDVSNRVEAPSSEAGEVRMCIGKSEWSIHEGNIVAFEETFADVRG